MQNINFFSYVIGLKESFIYDGLKRNKISIRAFVALLMRFCGQKSSVDPSAREMLQALRNCIFEKLIEHQDKRTMSNSEVKTLSSPNTSSANKENVSEPINVTCGTPLYGKHHSTSVLIRREKLRQSEQEKNSETGRKFKSRPLAKRDKQQMESNKKAGEEIHYGGKEDFILGFGHSISGDCSSEISNSSTANWDGKLSVQDVIEIAKNAHCQKHSRTAYDIMTSDHAMERFHIHKQHILHVQDTMNSTEFARDLRKKVPGLLDSGYSVKELKKQQDAEFKEVLQPERTATGWKVNAERLHVCLKYVYPWLPAEEYWRIYGDARTYGKQKSVLLAIGNLNNEQLLHNIKIQSPKELWPISIFYFADSRLNLELNLAGNNCANSSAGWLNQWLLDMKGKGHKMYLTGDSMFLDAIADSALDPKSETGFNLYNYETVASKGDVSKETGLRSGLHRTISRKFPESLLPALSPEDFLLCCDHMFTRITETLLTLRVKSIFSLEAESVISKKDRDCALKHLESNINLRGVRSGHFKFYFEASKSKLSQVSLNKSFAQLISAPPSYFLDAKYPHILENVAPKISCPGELTTNLQKALNWPSKKITEYDCETLIWEMHFKMHEICRLDPDPKLKV